MTHNKSNSEVARRCIALAQEMGFTVTSTGKGHFKCTRAGTPTVFFSGTPGDRKVLALVTCKLKRAVRAAKEQECSSIR